MKRLGIFLLVALFFLSSVFAAGSKEVSTPVSDEGAATEIDKAAFDALVKSGPVATDAEIASSAWASNIKKNGVMRIGGTRTSYLFSQLDETDGALRGFDSGIYKLLTNYILGDPEKFEFTQVTSATREAVLQSGQVDATIATYSITPQRAEVISFAGPYFVARQAILVRKGDKSIRSVDDLNGKIVATQAGSTGPAIIEEYAPNATIQEFSDDAQARTALEQGRVDAYVTDNTLLLNAVSKNPNAYEIAGDVFGPEDSYGIGLPKNSDGVAFVNRFLRRIIYEGLWDELWKISLGDRTGLTDVPEPPVF